MGAPYSEPYCAFACRAVISLANLTCTEESHHTHGATMAHAMPMTSAKCRADDDPRSVNNTPSTLWKTGVLLNSTMLAPQAAWDIQYKFSEIREHNGHLLDKYTIVLLVVGFGTPIAVTLISKLPIASTIFQKLNPYLVYPSTYIGGFTILNIILSCIGYQLLLPLKHLWGYDHRGEILAYVGYRTGEFAFALLPLTILFAGRNNILLWLTNWSHSTFLLLHRWVARLCALHTILHSIFLWAARVQTGTYKVDVKLAYWKWGIVGTVFVCLMLIFSLLWMRRWSYEIFLISHIIMAIFTTVGSWYHLMYRFGKTGSHEYWLYAAFVVWAFDRLARVFRIINNGAHRATVTELGASHVRIDIPHVRFSGKPGYHGYVYLPTVNPLRPCENPPFSVNATALLRSGKHSVPSRNSSLQNDYSKPEIGDTKNGAKIQEAPLGNGLTTTAGVTLYVRKSSGLTRHLQKHESLLTLLDGPYRNNRPEAVLSCDRLVLIGGGIGITGLLAFFQAHVNVKLAWSVKATDQAIVTDLSNVLDVVADKEIRVGERLDVGALLGREAASGYEKVGVVVCWPGGLSDEVRAVVSILGRHEKTIFELEVDAYSW
ncbi:hypothetical protein EJ08DRAFT_668513 [Tothia fuscella]|uniref:Ferric oxidoreductase domain-containing protein n=1 Tax=Tothia fuscella TaxID=1048955 RepID=A0A9P4NZP5_9PEZI|nr:hypothetical protein EJ08DRAFT_668513 [Tothia fuscella]